MKYVFSCIEQLDLAAEQLKIENPSYARFSLILTDNIIELMLHRKCVDEFREREAYKHYYEHKGFDFSLREKVLGQHFDEKVKFCHKIQAINSEEQDFILITHKYRNELYHSGVKYETILGSLAWHYHKLACDLFEKLEPPYLVFSSNDSPSPIVKKHLGENIHSGKNDILGEACKSLHSLRLETRSTFSSTLSQAIAKVLCEIDEAIEFVTHNTPDESSAEETISNVQIYHKHSVEIKNSTIIQSPEYANPLQMLEHLKSNWRPPISLKTIRRWKNRATELEKERNITTALRKFDKLRSDISEFEEIISEAAAGVDIEIQRQIDAARGK